MDLGSARRRPGRRRCTSATSWRRRASGQTTTILAKATVDDLDLSGKALTTAVGRDGKPHPNGVWLAWIKTHGLSDLYVIDNKFAPRRDDRLALASGAQPRSSSWPGRSRTTRATTRAARRTSTPRAELRRPGRRRHAHPAQRGPAVTAETIAVQFLPQGATRRIEEPTPGNCPLLITGHGGGRCDGPPSAGVLRSVRARRGVRRLRRPTNRGRRSIGGSMSGRWRLGVRRSPWSQRSIVAAGSAAPGEQHRPARRRRVPGRRSRGASRSPTASTRPASTTRSVGDRVEPDDPHARRLRPRRRPGGRAARPRHRDGGAGADRRRPDVHLPPQARREVRAAREPRGHVAGRAATPSSGSRARRTARSTRSTTRRSPASTPTPPAGRSRSRGSRRRTRARSSSTSRGRRATSSTGWRCRRPGRSPSRSRGASRARPAGTAATSSRPART